MGLAVHRRLLQVQVFSQIQKHMEAQDIEIDRIPAAITTAPDLNRPRDRSLHHM
jgi:hypothetical protein